MRRFEPPRHLRFARWQHVMEQRLLACKTTRGTWFLTSASGSNIYQYIYIYIIYIYIYLYKQNEIKICISRCSVWHVFREKKTHQSYRRKDQMDQITSPCAMLQHSLVADLVPVVVIFNVMQAPGDMGWLVQMASAYEDIKRS